MTNTYLICCCPSRVLGFWMQLGGFVVTTVCTSAGHLPVVRRPVVRRPVAAPSTAGSSSLYASTYAFPHNSVVRWGQKGRRLGQRRRRVMRFRIQHGLRSPFGGCDARGAARREGLWAEPTCDGLFTTGSLRGRPKRQALASVRKVPGSPRMEQVN